MPIAPTTAPIVMLLTEPLLITDVPLGGIVDYSGYILRATCPMECVVKVSSSLNNHTTNPNNGFCTIKLGIVDGNHLAANGVEISEVWDSKIEIGAVSNALGTGVWLNGGNSNCANNKIDIGAINGNGGNGLLMQTLSNDVTWNVQGNHITVGQVIANGASGVVAWIGAWANIIVVGPVEHNAALAACDNSGAVAPYLNIWCATGTNSNGVAGGPI